VIPERTPEKLDKGRAFKDARKAGQEVAGLNDWNLRWVGPEGYSGRAVREFNRRRKAARAAHAKNQGTTGGGPNTGPSDRKPEAP
jgi:hypothetical protein